MFGKLIICGLPIGNSEDISPRVIKTLQEVDLIAAEDTRTAALFLSQFEIKKPLISYHDFSHKKQRDNIIKELLSGKKIALISDAGMPMISDPGYHLVQASVEKGIELQVVPGPTALTTALAISGLPSDRFCFEGFLKRTTSQRREQLGGLAIETRTIIFYEAPHRLVETLQDILEMLGDRSCFLCRELTKKHEEHFRGTVSEILNKFKAKEPKGEFVIVLAGQKQEKQQFPPAYQDLKNILLAKNISKKDIIEILHTAYDLNKNELKKEFFC
jgi:16S rRNA (cytidine1402-2'-O)-methyltransferase